MAAPSNTVDYLAILAGIIEYWNTLDPISVGSPRPLVNDAIYATLAPKNINPPYIVFRIRGSSPEWDVDSWGESVELTFIIRTKNDRLGTTAINILTALRKAFDEMSRSTQFKTTALGDSQYSLVSMQFTSVIGPSTPFDGIADDGDIEIICNYTLVVSKK